MLSGKPLFLLDSGKFPETGQTTSNTMRLASAPITSSIEHRLEQLILDGDFSPGSQLPLQGRGIVRTQHGKGSFVSSILPEVEAESTLMHLFNDHARTVFDLFEVREHLEGQAAGLAAERATDKDMHRIRKAYEELTDCEAHGTQNRAQCDYRFHRSITEASHNPILINILNSLNILIRQSVEMAVNNLGHRENYRQQLMKYHHQIFNAVISRQPDWAQKAASTHVRQSREALELIEREEEHGLIRQ